SSASTDAVNGSQLYATNQAVQKNTGDITDINSSIADLAEAIKNVVGVGDPLSVQYDDASKGLITLGGD
ncbi:hypothetical protein PQR34_49225, partial [Paraburkholderia sediminicola]|uniref:hypothetical protein n=1 Tax=Paraburkholderia sediminicola TaxID=458836 RepID=UPI0038B933D6